jgi:propionyl-CoA carboxylase alpha chain
VIRRLLVANRGEIARRIFRTCRLMGVSTVAVFSDPDRDAPFVREADLAVSLGGATPAESYLRIEAVVEAARRSGADAVHPGYGFLAENAAFAQAVIDAGLVWVGPSPASIAAMGSKLESKRLVVEAGVPTLPSTDVTGMDPAALVAAAEATGYPVLVKASAGGGGKGMRIVADSARLHEEVEGARREAASAFGDDTVFLERYLEAPRHIEIQVFGDSHGNLVHLFERECSIQRRHQKIVEESPSPALTPELRQAMGEAAVRAAAAVGYVGAGTVEFLFQDGEFWFLEMNTRLQVEHPVTEEITGLDLVRLQLMVAAGEPLPDEALRPEAVGHAIEVRLYAEDPRNGFLPVTGRLQRFRFSDRVRVDTGVEDGSEVSIHYDPMLAKVVAWGETREEAAMLLAAELQAAELHGLTTNRDLLVRILRHPEFLAGQTDTHFLQRHHPAELGRPGPEAEEERLAAVAAAICAQEQRRAETPLQSTIPSGWRNNPSQLQECVFLGEQGEIRVGYRFPARGPLLVEVNQESVGSVRLHRAGPFGVGLEVDGLVRWYRVRRSQPGGAGGSDESTDLVHHVDGPYGYSRLLEKARFPVPGLEEEPGSLHAPMPGSVIKVLVTEGEAVAEGQVLVVLEAMKMEHSLRAPHPGTVTSVRTSPGDQVEAGEILVVVEET